MIVSDLFHQRLQGFIDLGAAKHLNQHLIGLEKESLRVDKNGFLSQRPHPEVFGSALTNPHITTDFSEALMELITPPCNTASEALEYLTDIHSHVSLALEDEILWNASMPCKVNGESYIPLARFGTSNAGTMKTVYRRGLGYRYGRVMQVIAGVHYNHSFTQSMWEIYQQIEKDEHSLQTFITEQYFGLLRNLQRVGWLIPYLFGASPAVCKSFLGGKKTNLQDFGHHTFYGPYATSLRMGDIGYQNNKENEIGVKACYDNLDEYIEAISYAIETSYPGYEKIGVKVDGKYRQLNTNILQIENEYYSTVRPKQPLNGNEKPIRALMARGVKYIELRSLDVNPFAAAGLTLEQLYFLEMLFIYALFESSPAIAPWERGEIDKNEMKVAHYGRKPDLGLMRNGDEILLKTWAAEVFEKMDKIAHMLDSLQGSDTYYQVLQKQLEAVNDPDKTLSAKVLQGMQDAGKGFFDFTWEQSQNSFQHNKRHNIEPDNERHLLDISHQSVIAQQRIEQSDTLSFDEYLAAYFEQ